MRDEIKELIDRLRCPKIQSCSVDTNKLPCSQCRKSLHNDAAEALENLDAQLDVCIQGDINKTRENEILLSALTKFGDQAQTVMVFEEMSELAKELCKNMRGKDNRDAIAEEIADVRIMLDQMEILHDCAASVSRWRESKLHRLSLRLEDEKGDRQ